MGRETARAGQQAAQFVGQEITPVQSTSEFSFEGPGILHKEDQENSKLQRQAPSTENQSRHSLVARHSKCVSVSMFRPL